MQHPDMSIIFLRACESFYYLLPCFPVVDATLTRVRMLRIGSSGEVGVAFEGFLRPCLLDGVTLPQVVIVDIEVCRSSIRRDSQVILE